MTIEYKVWLSLQAGNTGVPNAEYETLDKIKSLASELPCNVKITVNGIPEYCLQYDKDNDTFNLIPIDKK
jgi:hypothetical protein